MSDLYMSYKILESNEMHFKTCTKCGETLPATTEYFHKKKSGKYGLSSTCKKCRAEYGKQYHNDNKDKIAEQKKQYRATPQGQTSAFNGRCRRRTKEQNQGNGITKEQWLECMKFFNWKCAYSGQVLSKDTRSLDHIIPLNNGGKHEIWNLVPMYKPYNSSKHDKDMEEWYKQQDFYSEERLQKIYEWQEYAFTKYSLELEKVK